MADTPLTIYDRGRELRKQSPGSVFLTWAIKAAKYMRTEMVENHGRFDDVLVAFALSRLAMTYSALTSFCLAHGLGPVWGTQLNQRRSICASCSSTRTDSVGVERCHGYKGQTCGCPMKIWWRPGYLSWQIRLRNRRCPRGFFGRLTAKGASDVNENI